MGTRVTYGCDYMCGRTEYIMVRDISKLDPNAWIARQGWDVQERAGAPYYVCPSCKEGRPLDELNLIRGGITAMEGFRELDNGSDCYPVPCRSEAHDGENCLLHVYADDDPDMEGKHVQIIGSGCGSYHAQLVDGDGVVLIETGDEVWFG